MLEFNVEIKKHCRSFRKMNIGCGCHLSQKRGFEYTCTGTFDSIPIYSSKILIQYSREYSVCNKGRDESDHI